MKSRSGEAETRSKQTEMPDPLTIGVEISSRESMVPTIGPRTPLVDVSLCVCGVGCMKGTRTCCVAVHLDGLESGADTRSSPEVDRFVGQVRGYNSVKSTNLGRRVTRRAFVSTRIGLTLSIDDHHHVEYLWDEKLWVRDITRVLVRVRRYLTTVSSQPQWKCVRMRARRLHSFLKRPVEASSWVDARGQVPGSTNLNGAQTHHHSTGRAQ